MEIKFDDKALQKIIEAFRDGQNMHARVGILGSTDARDDGKETNASIGTKHELGIGVPQRSFLEMPIRTQLRPFLANSKLINAQSVADVANAGSLLPIVQKLAIAGEAVVVEAFQTGGFGEWIPSQMANKKVHMTLIESQQLRNSITSDVVAG